MRKVVVVEDPRAADGREVVAALDYLLRGVASGATPFELENRCAATGPFSAGAAVDRFARARRHLPDSAAGPAARSTPGPLGVLHTPGLNCSPSNQRTLDHISDLVARRGGTIRWIRADEPEAVSEIGALFIRDDTSIMNHTVEFARRAAARGIPVIDTPEVIERCADKALEAELFAARGLPTPRTLLLHAGNAGEVAEQLGYPFVLKRVDGSWSHDVWRIDGPADLDRRLPQVLDGRLLAVAQEYVPTPFDWRVAVLNGELLFAARYHAVPGHWQVARWDGDNLLDSGRTEAVPLGELPEEIGVLALAAANAVGEGLFGVDIKPTDRGPLLIEVNDCVDLDVGCEDGAQGDIIYQRILNHLGRP